MQAKKRFADGSQCACCIDDSTANKGGFNCDVTRSQCADHVNTQCIGVCASRIKSKAGHTLGICCRNMYLGTCPLVYGECSVSGTGTHVSAAGRHVSRYRTCSIFQERHVAVCLDSFLGDRLCGPMRLLGFFTTWCALVAVSLHCTRIAETLPFFQLFDHAPCSLLLSSRPMSLVQMVRLRHFRFLRIITTVIEATAQAIMASSRKSSWA